MIILFGLFIFGLVFGSFLNVLSDRLPAGENPWVGRSHCDNCKKTLRWFELIPLFSYVIQGGRCRRCGKKLSWYYPVAELAAGLLFVYAFILNPDQSLLILANLLIFSGFLVNFLSDLKYQILLDSMLIVSLVGVIIRLMVLNPFLVLWQPYLLSALAAGGFFFALWYGTHGRGMGFGDVKLGAVLGLYLGYPDIIYILYIAFLTGALWGVILIIAGKKKLKSQVAFGPFLIGGSILALQFGGTITGWLKGIIW